MPGKISLTSKFLLITISLFAIFPSPVFAQTISVTAPNGGQCLKGGSSYTITWSFSGVDHVAIAYRPDGSQPATYLGGGSYFAHPTTSGATSYNWTVPSDTVDNTVKIWLDGHNTSHGSLGQDGSDTGFSIDSFAPTAPILSSTSGTSVPVALSWTVSSDAGCKGLTGYKVWRDGVEIATGLTGTTYTDNTSTDGKIYSYVVKAYDDFHSTDSNTISVTTDDVTAPSIPNTPTTSPTQTTNKRPSWDWPDSTDNVGVAKYQVCWAQAQGCTSVMAEPTSSGYTHTADLSDGNWYFRAKAVDAANNASGFSGNGSVLVDTTAPSISSVPANNIGETTATISWTTNESATSQAEYGLTVSYGLSTSGDSSFKTSHSVSLSGLAGGATYHYRVKSKDAAGNLATSGDFTF